MSMPGRSLGALLSSPWRAAVNLVEEFRPFFVAKNEIAALAE